VDATELAFAGATEQAALLRAGELTPRDLVEVYLERIERIDPELGAFRVVLADEARAAADGAAERLRAGDESPMLGIPVAIKDEVYVEGQANTFGTGAGGGPAAEDSAVVARLRAAGAILIGITKVPELTMWAFTETKTWGITRNPWDLERTPGGSSGGSAAAVAAGLAPVALGTDGLGSVRIPAACCGLVGIKTQRGRVSFAPQENHWHGLSVVGPIARTVADAAMLLDAMAERPGERPFTEEVHAPAQPLRIAFSAKPPLPQPVRAPYRAALDQTVELLRSLGHHVEDRDPPTRAAYLHATPRYLRGIHDDARALPRPDRLERRTRRMAQLGGWIRPSVLARGEDTMQGRSPELNEFFADIDVLLTPAIPQLPLRIGAYEGRGWALTANGNAPYSSFNAPWNVTGQPGMAIPAGFTGEGMPLSVQIVGKPHAEATLISLAAQLEAERPWADRRPSLAE
jgi:amidase